MFADSNGKITRCVMLARTVHATATLAVASNLQPLPAEQPSSQTTPALVWDAHGHLKGASGTPRERITKLLEYADRVGVDKVIVFTGFPRLHDPPPEQIRRDNDEVLQAVRHSQGRAFAFVYLKPKHTQQSLKELGGPITGL